VLKTLSHEQDGSESDDRRGYMTIRNFPRWRPPPPWIWSNRK